MLCFCTWSDLSLLYLCLFVSVDFYRSLFPLFPSPSIFVLFLLFKPFHSFCVSVFGFLNSCHRWTDTLCVYECVCVCMCVWVITTCWDSCAVLVIMGSLKWDCWHNEGWKVHRLTCSDPLCNITLTCAVHIYSLSPFWHTCISSCPTSLG